MNKILSIVIPVFNKFKFTKSCLNDLSKLPSDHEVIIIDNGSLDETYSMLQDSLEIVYKRNLANEGFARACNYGYEIASAPNVLFLNNDIRVKSNHDNWTKQLIDNCSKGLVGPTMGQLDKGLNFVQEANKFLPGNSYMSGWCIAASKEIWNKLEIPRNPLNVYDKVPPPQIFSEDFFCYFEDTDLSFRARKLGIPFIVQDIPVVHFGKVSSGQLNTRELYIKAREIFIKKWKNKL